MTREHQARVGLTAEQARFIKFLLVGVLNTAFGYSVFAGLILLDVWYPLAMGISTIAGILFNYASTGGLVFKSRGWRSLPRFVLVYGVTYCVNVAAIRVTNAVGIPILLAAAALLLPSALLSYILQRVFVFKARATGQAPAGLGRSREPDHP